MSTDSMAVLQQRGILKETYALWTPTSILLASWGHKVICFSLLYKHHADISLGDNAGKYILHWACCGGNIAIVNHVLSSKIVHIDSRDHGGMTPAMVAAEKGRKNVLDFLIKEGADLSFKDSFSNDAYQLAALSGHGDMLEEA